jgi:acyl-CoA synthetase (AMP-forming)/AMP-acid ligase II
VLLGFPKIGDVAVFAVPHDEWGEGVMEAVEPQEGVRLTRVGRGDPTDQP